MLTLVGNLDNDGEESQEKPISLGEGGRVIVNHKLSCEPHLNEYVNRLGENFICLQLYQVTFCKATCKSDHKSIYNLIPELCC